MPNTICELTVYVIYRQGPDGSVTLEDRVYAKLFHAPMSANAAVSFTPSRCFAHRFIDFMPLRTPSILSAGTIL